MSLDKENKINNDHWNASPKSGQTNQNQDKKQSDSKTDRTKQGSGMNPTKFDKPDQRSADDANQDDKKDIDAERHPEEQVTRPKEFKKEEQKYNDKSVRA